MKKILFILVFIPVFAKSQVGCPLYSGINPWNTCINSYLINGANGGGTKQQVAMWLDTLAKYASMLSSSPLTTKGDLYVFGTTNTRLPVGSNGQILISNSSAPNGVSWANPSSSSANFANTDLTFTGNRSHDASGYSLFIDNISAVNFHNIGFGGFAINMNGVPDIFLVNNIAAGREVLRCVANIIGGIDSIKIHNHYYLPYLDGTLGQIITTDGSGNLSWTSNFAAKYRDLTFLAQTGPRVLAAYTPTVTGLYNISGAVNITAVATDILSFQVSWTDENNAPQTEILPATQNGNITYTFGATKHYSIGDFSIYAQQGFPIVVSTILNTGGGTITYDAGAKITK